MLFKTVEASCFTIGPTVTAYYTANFTVDALGYYYRDMESGIALGVFLTALDIGGLESKPHGAMASKSVVVLVFDRRSE
jgi:hypothetical protein